MPDHESPDYLGSLGSFDDDATRSLTDRMLGDAEDKVGGSIATALGARISEPLPTNQATMLCLRGPCIHFWELVARFDSGDDEIRRQAVRACTHFVGEETPLTGQNVFQCSQWWPASLLWIPKSWRAALRPALEEAWEWMLKQRGYDFAWRVTDGRKWRKDDFCADAPDRRGKSGLGGATPSKTFHPPGNGTDAGGDK